MASHSYTTSCPNCDEDADALEDTREGNFIWCPHCGLHLQPSIKQVTLKELNEWRQTYNESAEVEPGDPAYLKPLRKKPKWRL